MPISWGSRILALCRVSSGLVTVVHMPAHFVTWQRPSDRRRRGRRGRRGRWYMVPDIISLLTRALPSRSIIAVTCDRSVAGHVILSPKRQMVGNGCRMPTERRDCIFGILWHRVGVMRRTASCWSVEVLKWSKRI